MSAEARSRCPPGEYWRPTQQGCSSKKDQPEFYTVRGSRFNKKMQNARQAVSLSGDCTDREAGSTVGAEVFRSLTPAWTSSRLGGRLNRRGIAVPSSTPCSEGEHNRAGLLKVLCRDGSTTEKAEAPTNKEHLPDGARCTRSLTPRRSPQFAQAVRDGPSIAGISHSVQLFARHTFGGAALDKLTRLASELGRPRREPSQGAREGAAKARQADDRHPTEVTRRSPVSFLAVVSALSWADREPGPRHRFGRRLVAMTTLSSQRRSLCWPRPRKGWYGGFRKRPGDK